MFVSDGDQDHKQLKLEEAKKVLQMLKKGSRNQGLLHSD